MKSKMRIKKFFSKNKICDYMFNLCYQCVISFFFFIFICNNSFSQTSHTKIVESWDKLLLVDDREKNFRLPSFLDDLSKNVFLDEENALSGWVYEKAPDYDYNIAAGVLTFSNQNSLLIWLISLNEEKTSCVFSKELDSWGLAITNLTINFDSNQTFSIRINDNKYVDVPDIQIKILFSKLKYDKPDTEKEKISLDIWERLQKLLEDKLLFDNGFSDYEQLATVISDDKKVKICTWNIENKSGEHFFYGGLVINTSSKPIVYELKDEKKSIKNHRETVLTPDKWYGCIYYDIIENQYKGNTYYTLIGFNGNNAFTQIKLIDILTFSEKDNSTPKFGISMFTNQYKNNRRLIFEYGKNTTMMLRYDANVKMIVMDNLSPSEPYYKNDFRFYGPDFSHNGLKFDKGEWIFMDDIDLRNSKSFSNEDLQEKVRKREINKTRKRESLRFND